MTVRFNFNDQVKIRIKETGYEILFRYYADLGLPMPDILGDDDGVVIMQLHHVMHIFGPHLVAGIDPPIEMEAEFYHA